jgi:hypothetical protein
LPQIRNELGGTVATITGRYLILNVHIRLRLDQQLQARVMTIHGSEHHRRDAILSTVSE